MIFNQSYHRNVIFLEGRRVAAEVEGGGALVAANEVAALAAGVADVVVVALAFKYAPLSFSVSISSHVHFIWISWF